MSISTLPHFSIFKLEDTDSAQKYDTVSYLRDLPRLSMTLSWSYFSNCECLKIDSNTKEALCPLSVRCLNPGPHTGKHSAS